GRIHDEGGVGAFTREDDRAPGVFGLEITRGGDDVPDAPAIHGAAEEVMRAFDIIWRVPGGPTGARETTRFQGEDNVSRAVRGELGWQSADGSAVRDVQNNPSGFVRTDARHAYRQFDICFGADSGGAASSGRGIVSDLDGRRNAFREVVERKGAKFLNDLGLVLFRV